MKGQVWQLDFIFSIVLVSLVLALFIGFVSLHTDDVDIDDLVQVTSSMSQGLVTSGIPHGWNKNTVQLVGLTDGGSEINITKITQFYSMNESELRVLFTDRYQYMVQLFVDNVAQNISGTTFVGINKTTPVAQMQVDRYLLYNTQIARLEVTVWE